MRKKPKHEEPKPDLVYELEAPTVPTVQALMARVELLEAALRAEVKLGGGNPDEHSENCDLVLFARTPELIRGCGCYRRALEGKGAP